MVMKFNHEKSFFGHYHGLTTWLNANVGQIDVDYWFVSIADNTGRLSHIGFKDPAKEILTILRWGV